MSQIYNKKKIALGLNTYNTFQIPTSLFCNQYVHTRNQIKLINSICFEYVFEKACKMQMQNTNNMYFIYKINVFIISFNKNVIIFLSILIPVC